MADRTDVRAPLVLDKVLDVPAISMIGLPAIPTSPCAFPGDVADSPESTPILITAPELAEVVADAPTRTDSVETFPLVLDTVADAPTSTPVDVTAPLALDAVTDEPVSAPSSPTAPLAPDAVADSPASTILSTTEPLAIGTTVADNPDIATFLLIVPLALLEVGELPEIPNDVDANPVAFVAVADDPVMMPVAVILPEAEATAGAAPDITAYS